MFDWALLVLAPLFLLINRLPGNVVIIVAEASICSICVRGGTLVSNPFSRVLMGGRGVKGAGTRRPALMYAGVSRSRLTGGWMVPTQLLTGAAGTAGAQRPGRRGDRGRGGSRHV